MDQELQTGVLVGSWRTLLNMRRADAQRVHSPDGNMLLREMTSRRHLLYESMTLNQKSDSVNRRVFTSNYLKNDAAKFHRETTEPKIFSNS